MDSEEILYEVMSRLPAKSLIRSSAVSKTCSSFLSQDFFIWKHSERALFNDDPGFFIQEDMRWGKVELHKLSKNEENIKNIEDCGVPNTVCEFLSSTAKILGSYNGLLIMLRNRDENHKELILFNPVTQKTFTLPNPTSDPILGVYIESDISPTTQFPDNYKVVMLTSVDWSGVGLHMYTKAHGWEEIDNFNAGARDLLYDRPVYCNGALHFISDTWNSISKGSPYYKPYIVACDIYKQTSRRLKLPKAASRKFIDPTCEMRIFKWGKSTSSFSPSQSSICLVRLRKSAFMVWVLCDYDTVLWKLILKTRVRAMTSKEPNRPVICGFSIINGDYLLFATQQKIYRCRLSLSNEGVRSPVAAEEICSHDLNMRYLCITTYANTLRPCGSEEHPLN